MDKLPEHGDFANDNLLRLSAEVVDVLGKSCHHFDDRSRQMLRAFPIGLYLFCNGPGDLELGYD
jgi:hypothetical protein